jgi:hypothetical protein
MSTSPFIQSIWKALTLGSLQTQTSLEFGTPDQIRERSIQPIDVNLHKASIVSLSRRPNLSVDSIIQRDTIGYAAESLPSVSSRLFEERDRERDKLNWFAKDEVRFSIGSSDGLTVLTGTHQAFKEERRRIRGTSNGYSYRGETYRAISLGLLNESLLFNRQGDAFRTVNRRQAARLSMANRVISRSIGLEEGAQSDNSRTDLIRSFQLSRSQASRRWLGDDLYVADTRARFSDEDGVEVNREALVFNGRGIALASASTDGSTNPAATEISQISFDADAFPRQLRDEFRAALQATRRAERTTPVFAGYSGANLGFDWLTNIPDQAARGNRTARDILSETGPSISSFDQNQIFLALGAVDILTGRGRDLVVLADDVDNNAVNTVPRIHDFDPERDRIFIPQDIFSGLDGDDPGALAARRFRAGRQANRRSQRLIYDSRNGLLYHDPDGNRRANQQLIAAFLNTPELTAENVLIG